MEININKYFCNHTDCIHHVQRLINYETNFQSLEKEHNVPGSA